MQQPHQLIIVTFDNYKRYKATLETIYREKLASQTRAGLFSSSKDTPVMRNLVVLMAFEDHGELVFDSLF